MQDSHWEWLEHGLANCFVTSLTANSTHLHQPSLDVHRDICFIVKSRRLECPCSIVSQEVVPGEFIRERTVP